MFFINAYQAEKHSRVEAESTAFHETIPGHHLQGAIALERKDIHPIGRYLGNSGYAEGWALYAERLADETETVFDGCRTARHAFGSGVARGAAGGGFRNSHEGLDAPAGDRLHAGAHRRRRARRGFGDRSLHYLSRAGDLVHAGQASRIAKRATRRNRRWERSSTSKRSTIACWKTARYRSRF